MKTALLIIPSTDGTVDREAYLTDCIELVMKEDFLPFCPDLYKHYTRLGYTDYIKKILPGVDAVYLFVDFGIDEKMFNVIDTAEKDKLIYKRKIPFDLNKYVISLPKILKDVSKRMDIPLEIMQSRTRKREVVDARFVFFRRARENTKESLKNIGLMVSKDHATVLSGLKQAYNTRQVIKLYEKLFS